MIELGDWEKRRDLDKNRNLTLILLPSWGHLSVWTIKRPLQRIFTSFHSQGQTKNNKQPLLAVWLSDELENRHWVHFIQQNRTKIYRTNAWKCIKSAQKLNKWSTFEEENRRKPVEVLTEVQTNLWWQCIFETTKDITSREKRICPNIIMILPDHRKYLSDLQSLLKRLA